MLIKPLQPADVPAALRLSTQAGWNQLATDWQRMLHLWPDTCLAGWFDGQLIATATLATYGTSLAWVGMVLVDEEHRRRGFGGAIFDAVTQMAKRRGIAQLALDASDEGRPVYLKRGFVDVGPISRWTGTPGTHAALPANDLDIQPVQLADWPELFSADLAGCGIDRSQLLQRLSSEPNALVRVARHAKQLAAFAFARPGRTASFLGPIWAADRPAASTIALSLLDELARTHARPVIVDLPGPSWLQEPLIQLGLQPQRRLTRMTLTIARSSSAPLCSPHLPAAAGFELG